MRVNWNPIHSNLPELLSYLSSRWLTVRDCTTGKRIVTNRLGHMLTKNRYISLVAASCMVLYGYDASVYNSVQGSKHWVAWFNNPVSSAHSGTRISTQLFLDLRTNWRRQYGVYDWGYYSWVVLRWSIGR